MNYPYGRNLLLNSVGFDRIFDAFERIGETTLANKAQSYPPYNILKVSENAYRIEIAAAGFKPNQLEVTVEENKLIVSGRANSSVSGEYLHRGIGTRDFRHEFTLAETVEVRAADMIDGFLTIQLVNVVPDEKKPRKILIGSSSAQVLQADSEKLAA